MTQVQGFSAERTIKSGYFDTKAFQQKGKLLLVLKTGIAGLQFHLDFTNEEDRELIEKLVPGAELFIYREMDNEYDQWAISVYTDNDKHIGYVTRFKNEAIARLMDCGKRFLAFVDDPSEQPPEPGKQYSREKNKTTENFSLPFSIYLEDK